MKNLPTPFATVQSVFLAIPVGTKKDNKLIAKRCLTAVLLGITSLGATAQSRGAVNANECVTVKRDDHDNANLYNACGWTITVKWCVVGVDCRGKKYYSNTWNIRGHGGTYPVSQSKDRDVAYAACAGSNVSIQSRADGAFACP